MDLSAPLYYERAFSEGRYEVFDNLLIGSYSEEFTREDEIKNNVTYERQYSSFLEQLLRRFSLTLDTNSPYFLGFGTTAIVYRVSNPQGNIYATKFTWNENDFSSELAAYYLIKQRAVTHLFPKLYFSYFEHQPVEIESQTLGAFGILVQDQVAMDMRTYLKTHKMTRQIRRSFANICEELEEAGLVHADLSLENISIDPETLKLGFLDYADVADHRDKKAQTKFRARFQYLMETFWNYE